jgi:hypothetical protein
VTTAATTRTRKNLLVDLGIPTAKGLGLIGIVIAAMEIGYLAPGPRLTGIDSDNIKKIESIITHADALTTRLTTIETHINRTSSDIDAIRDKVDELPENITHQLRSEFHEIELVCRDAIYNRHERTRRMLSMHEHEDEVSQPETDE